MLPDAAIAVPSSLPAPCVPGGGHPLEIFRVFRRWPRGLVRDIVYTFIWNTLIALILTAVFYVSTPETTPWRHLRTSFVLAQCIGYLIHFEFMVGDWLTGYRVHRARLPLRTAYYTVLPVFGVFGGYWLGFRLLHMADAQRWVFSAGGAMSVVVLSILLSGMLLAVFIPRERAAQAQADFERERARVAAAEREAMLARLQLLQAQVEPHFLYNSLANIVSVVDGEPQTAKRMLEQLIAMLRGSAAAAIATDATLREQVEHLRAYLELMALRMGPRLRYRIDVAPGLDAARLPPLLLQPLVENAIRHGLEPAVAGGEVVVAATRAGDHLRITVEDTGIGILDSVPAKDGATGLGLPNVRARLAALYGDAASLTLEEPAHGRGTRAVIDMPLHLEA